MKKVGILTEYYNSRNYGGVLQAYALCRVIKSLGYSCEQIQYSVVSVGKRKSNIKKIRTSVERIYFKIKFYGKNKKFKQFLENNIPHSKEIYDDNTIKHSINQYDVFVTGSDQVWNPNWKKPAYFLEFVPSNKKKIAYAASLAVDELSEAQKLMFNRRLKDYIGVSVREKSSVGLLQDLVDEKVYWTADPTLLLKKEQWDEIVPGNLMKMRYVFCYFLGHDGNSRRIVKEYAKNKGLKIVNLAHVKGNFRRSDMLFADKNLYNISPTEFISLIKFAEIVFTDSFHAVSFSSIYHKEYFVFSRDKKDTMSSRIYSMVELFECGTHFCNSEEKMSVEYIDSIRKINYLKTEKKINNFREESFTFLENKLRIN